MQVLKKELRSAYSSARKNIPVEQFRLGSQKIIRRIQSLNEIKDAQVLHVFWPITKNNEIDTRPLIQTLHKLGRHIVLPYMVSFSSDKRAGSRLEHRLFTGETNLRANRWDVYEPTSTQTVPITALDAVIVPALAVDQEGVRLGYGKGYYDEFLSQVECPTICPIFDTFFVDTLPRDEHDIPVKIVVSEIDTYRIT